MAIAHITFRSAMEGIKPVPAAMPRAAETITTSGTSAQTTITAKAGEMLRVTTDVGIFIAVGASPTAASGSGDYIPAGQVADLGYLTAGWKVAVIEA